MWLPFTLLLLVGAVVADFEHGWQIGNEYNYLVRSRTFTGLDQLSEQYSGILIKALLTVQPKDQQTLRAKVSKAQYANVHKKLPEGWDSQISDHMLELRDLPISEQPFEIKMKHGVIRDLIVDRQVPTWEVNVLKSIVSQLQVDTQGENAKRSRSTQVPNDEEPFAMFKAMEDSVGGRCEVLYDITPLADHVLQSKPELVPMPHLKNDGQHIDILKTKNYSRCEQRMDYHFGITGKTNWEPGSNENGRFLSKSSTSRIIISGNLKRFTIQSSVTTNKMFVSPRLYDYQSGVVVSKMNLTLANVNKASNHLPAPNNPESTGNLVYTYNNPFADSNSERKPGRPSISHSSKASPNSGSVSSVSSSEESRRQRENTDRSSNSDSASSSSISDSNEADFWQPKPSLEEPPRNPLLPLFIGYKGRSIATSNEVDPVKSTKDLVLQIANDLEDPSNIPEQESLEKFTILCSLLRTMSRRQIAEAESDMHLSSNDLKSNDKSQAKKQNAWAVLRDAVTQAGTGPAFLTIKDWIEKKKIEGFEAADVVSRIPKTARTPTAEYVHEFFELAKSLQDRNDRLLASTAILSFSELVRHAQINSRTIHNRYPVHSFGRLSPKHNEAVVQEYIPFLAQQLKKAMKDGDSPRIQVNILALGNIAHPKILSVFEPYLEGKEPTTTFQRTLMVSALSKLADLSPKLARSVLYKIYLNTMESHEVRCTAVFLLMKTNPPLGMLQRMAEFTQYDTNRHVNSAVKSTIQSIASLERPESKEMANKARAAQNLLTKENYNLQYSQGYTTDSFMQEQNLAYRLIVSYIGSEDSVIPQASYIGLETSYGEFNAPTAEVAYMVSSVKALFDMYSNDKEDTDQAERSMAEKIADTLKIQPEEPQKIEGNMMWNTKYGSRFWPFDKRSIESIPDVVVNHLASLRDGAYVNMNKMVNYEVTLSFPTETGFPFVYTLKIPTLFKMSGTTKTQADRDMILSVKSEKRLVYSKKLQGRIGFVTPFEHQQFVSGVDMNFQAYAPLKVEVGMNTPKKSFQLKLWPMKGEENAKFLHYSVVPYTSRHDILNLRPVLSNKNTHKVYAGELQSITESVPMTNLKVFKLQFESDSIKGESSESELNFQDPLSLLTFPWSQHSDRYRKTEVSMSLQQEQKEPIVFTASFDSMHSNADSQNSQEWSSRAKAIQASNKEPDSQERRQQFLREAVKGIKSARASVVDLRLVTPGDKYKSRNGMTLAWARSNVDDKARTLLYWNSEFPEEDMKYEVCAAAQSMSSPNSLLNYEDTIKSKPKSEFDMNVRYGRSCTDEGEINIRAKLVQSNELNEKIRKSPIVKRCEEQMRQGNKALKACQDANTAARNIDEMDMSIELRSKLVQIIANQAIEKVRDIGYADVNVDFTDPKNQGKDKIDVKVKLNSEMNKAKVKIHTPSMDVDIPEVDLLDLGINEQPMLSTSDDMNMRTLPEQQNEFACVLDNTRAQTFDDKEYPLKLGKCWHVAMTAYPQEKAENRKEHQQIPVDERVTVMTREIEDGQKEVKIFLGNKEIRLTPGGSQLEATVNKQKVSYSQDRSYQEKKSNGKIAFEIFELPNGAIRLTSDKYDVDAIYDGKRIQIKASNKYRKSVRGLCGNFDGEPENDFTSPKNCLLRQPEEFQASYALTSQECQGPALENARKVESSVCIRRSHRMSNVISDLEAGRFNSEKNSWGYHHGDKKDSTRCNSYRTQVITQNDKICFTTRPVPVCADGCSPVNTKTKNYQFHCMERNEASLKMKERVEKGANPDLSQKTPSLTRPIGVPLECRA